MNLTEKEKKNMGCCDQRRTAINSSSPVVAAAPVTAPQVVAPSPRPSSTAPMLRPRGAVQFEYLETSRILVTGPVTHRGYEFSSARRVNAVDSRDAEILLKTRFFRIRQ